MNQGQTEQSRPKGLLQGNVGDVWEERGFGSFECRKQYLHSKILEGVKPDDLK